MPGGQWGIGFQGAARAVQRSGWRPVAEVGALGAALDTAVKRAEGTDGCVK